VPVTAPANREKRMTENMTAEERRDYYLRLLATSQPSAWHGWLIEYEKDIRNETLVHLANTLEAGFQRMVARKKKPQ
jgi:hypothetical protein